MEKRKFSKNEDEEMSSQLSSKLVLANLRQMPLQSFEPYAAAAIHRKTMHYFLKFYVKNDWEQSYLNIFNHAEEEGLVSSEEAKAFLEVDALLRPEKLNVKAAIEILDNIIDKPGVSPISIGAALIGRDNLLTGPPVERPGPVHYAWWHADMFGFLASGGDAVVAGIVSLLA